MSILRYYQEESRYLREAGVAFSEEHADAAEMLGLLEEGKDYDPYVKLLFEGFAFLSGRVRETIEDEMPAYTESLFELLHPQYLKPFPAVTVLEFKPKEEAVQDSLNLSKGTQVRSSPLGDEKVACTFGTMQTLALPTFFPGICRAELVRWKRQFCNVAFCYDARGRLQVASASGTHSFVPCWCKPKPGILDALFFYSAGRSC